MINIKPTNLPHVKTSPNNKTPKINTSAGAKLIKGYAFVISNWVIAAIQKSEAIKALKNPEKINGSSIASNRNLS
jgi:hypothetical protein